MSLRARLAVAVAGLVLLAVTLASTMAWFSASSELNGEVDYDLRARVHTIAATIDGFAAARNPEIRNRFPDFGRRSQLLPPDTVLLVLSATGEVVATVEGDPEVPVGDELIALAKSEVAGSTEPLMLNVEVDDSPWRLAAVPLRSGGAAVVGRDLSEVDAVLTGLRRRLAVIGLLSAAAAALIGWMVTRRATGPLEHLTSAAERVAETRDLSVQIPVAGRDEVGRLAASFDTMLGALATSQEQQRRLIQDAGHELRTPLTSLRTNVEVLRRIENIPAEDRAKILEDLGSEVGELTSLVEELVELAGVARPEGRRSEVVRLDDLVRSAAGQLERRTGRSVVIDAEPVSVDAVSEDLARAVTNLLTNAAKFSPPESPIEVSVSGGAVKVIDHGPGIDHADRPRVFDRFYRAPAARSAPGSGLGLSIVRQIVEEHGGRCFVEETDGGGATVGFELPTAG